MRKEEKTAIISFTTKGLKIAEKISEKLNEKAVLINKETVEGKIKSKMEEIFSQFDNIIFISSTGIAVRFIAPYIKSKTQDPAVLVIDDMGKYVISLLSGHIGGANNLAFEIAEIIGAEPVITTASDGRNIDAVDTFAIRNDYHIDSMEMTKTITHMMVEDKKIRLLFQLPKYIDLIDNKFIVKKELHAKVEIDKVSDKQSNNSAEIQKELEMDTSIYEEKYVKNDNNDKKQFLKYDNVVRGYVLHTNDGMEVIMKEINLERKTETKFDSEYYDNGELQKEAFKGSIIISNRLYTDEEIKKLSSEKPYVILRPKNLYIGVGCRRGTECSKIKSLIEEVFTENGYSLDSVEKMGSIDIKRDEKGLLEISKGMGWDFEVFSKDELVKYEHLFEGSDFVKKTVGVGAVSETVAYALSENIVIDKVAKDGVTVTVSESRS